jgi:acetyltransferase-like isoleucine patch superfamily enzyme
MRWALLLLLGAGCLGADPVPPQPVLLEGSGSLALSLAADELGPGSSPLTTTLALAGAPFGTRGPYELGSTSVVIATHDPVRTADALDRPRATLAELSLFSLDAVTVLVGDVEEAWSLRVSIAPAGAGSLVVDEGRVSGELPVSLVLRFERDGRDPVVLTRPAAPLVLTGGRTLTDCPTAPLASRHMPLTLCISGLQANGAGLSLTLVPAAPGGGVETNVESGATVDPSARLARGAHIVSGAIVEADAVIGAGATVQAGARVGRGATVGEGAIVGQRAVVGDDAVVGEGVELGADAELGSGSSLGARTRVGLGTRLDTEVHVGDDAVIGVQVAIALGARLDGGVTVGDEASIGARLALRAGTVVAPGESVTSDRMGCLTAEGEATLASPATCVAEGGSPTCWFPGDPVGTPNRLRSPERVRSVDSLDGIVRAGLETAIDDAGVAVERGGAAFVGGFHDCDDYAEELRTALEGAGYTTTFTVVIRYAANPAQRWWNAWRVPARGLAEGHAVTDVHLADGTLLWLEPQLGVAAGALTHPTTRLDFDGDGMVETTDHPGTDPTDGEYRIEVYDSRASCEAAGRRLD